MSLQAAGAKGARPPKVAIIGRPNVGKSTLFNRLTGKKLALVDDTPGVTRDRREGDGRLGDLRFSLIDTAGLEEAGGESLTARMRRQTEQAIEEADLCLMLVDSRAGLTATDEDVAELLRRTAKPVILLANKCEARAGKEALYEAYALGIGEPIAFSAEHGEGLDKLYDLMLEHLGTRAVLQEGDEEEDEEGFDPDVEEEIDLDIPLRVAIVGRPNAGKSTLVNRLLGEERMLTGPEAGITRDAIGVEWVWQAKGKPPRRVKLFDTAGMRRRAKVTQKLEKLAVADTLRAIRFAEVVVLMLDSTMPFEKQDLHIADLIEREGRGFLIALNKWDLVEEPQSVLHELRLELERLLPQVRGVPVVTLSAATGRGVNRLMPEIDKVHRLWNRRISTAKLNRWLREVVAAHPPPASHGRPVSIKYATQVKSRPPSFAFFSSRAPEVPTSYKRYLVNSLREAFELPAVPIRIYMRKPDNPYAGRR